MEGGAGSKLRHPFLKLQLLKLEWDGNQLLPASVGMAAATVPVSKWLGHGGLGPVTSGISALYETALKASLEDAAGAECCKSTC